MEKFNTYIKDNGLKKSWVANEAKISRAHLWKVMAGREVATADFIERVNRVTDGHITSDDYKLTNT